MDNERRKFFKNFGVKAAGLASAAAIPAVITEIDFKAEFEKLSRGMNKKYDDATATIENYYQEVTQRIDAAAFTQAYQQALIHFLFLLMLISFIIDGGMTLTWMMT